MDDEMVKVMATQRGHFGDRVREVGETFEVPRDLLTAKKKLDDKGKPTDEVVPPTWFEEVVDEEVKTTKTVRKSQRSADDLA